MGLRYPERKRLTKLHLKVMLVHKTVWMLDYILKLYGQNFCNVSFIFLRWLFVLQILLTRKAVTVLVMSLLNKQANGQMHLNGLQNDNCSVKNNQQHQKQQHEQHQCHHFVITCEKRRSIRT